MPEQHVITIDALGAYCVERGIQEMRFKRVHGVWVVALVSESTPVHVVERDPSLQQAVAVAVTAWEERPTA